MKKFIITSLMSILIINFSGCSSFKDITLEEITNNNQRIIEVKTVDEKTYNFSSKGYEVRDDTLHGRFGLELINEDLSVPFKGKIAIIDIISLKAKKAGIDFSPFDIILIGVLTGILILFGIHITK